MTPEIRHLLGGYATGTLTEVERARLFAAALEDQSLFDALAEEQPLKDLLDEPESRGYLLAELDRAEETRVSLPVAMAPAASKARPPARFWLPFGAVMVALVATGWLWWGHRPVPQAEIARNVPTAPLKQPEPAPATIGVRAQVPREAQKPVPAPKPALKEAVTAPAPAADAAEQPANQALDLRAERRAAAPAAASSMAAISAPPPYRVLRLEQGNYVPVAATARFRTGDRIVIHLPSEPKPELTHPNGTPIVLERDADGYRSVPIDLAAGPQEFILSPQSDKSIAPTLRIRLNVD